MMQFRRGITALRWPDLCVALACALCLGLLTMLIVSGVRIPGDAELVQLAVAMRNPPLTAVIELLTFASSSVPALAITVVLGAISCWRARRVSLGAWWATGAYLGAVACNVALRVAVGRLRPEVEYIPHLLPEIQTSFQRFCYPSGHAGAVLVAYGALAHAAWPHARWRWSAGVGVLLFILAVGFGRVYLGVHWPTDVLGGYLLGGAWLGMGLGLRGVWPPLKRGVRRTRATGPET